MAWAVLGAALSIAAAPLRAQGNVNTETLWNCKDKDGRTTLTNQQNDTSGKDCRIVHQQRISTVPAPAAVTKPASKPSPANFPRESPTDRATAKSKQRETIERELVQEESMLADARKKLSEQESIRSGDEKNYAKVLERLRPYKDTVEVHQKNVEALKRELGNLSALTGPASAMAVPQIADFPGLELLGTAVVALDDRHVVRYANPAAEDLLGAGARSLVGQPFVPLFTESASLKASLDDALKVRWSYRAQTLNYERPGRQPLPLSCVVTPIDVPGTPLLAELRPIQEQLRVEREERLLDQQEATRELIRNLAHEIKNPLGGLRGSAQLLERELDRPELREYTQVIIKEADRLQVLLDRLLTPRRTVQLGQLNIHEVLERVRSLVQAEFPEGISVLRNYDPSVPDLVGDMEQLIQAVLNVVRNAAQALLSEANKGQGGTIVLRTRSARQVTVARRRHKLALELQVIDDGPGVPEDIRERIFNPLVSGREGGSGIGLSLVQTYVQNHGGVVEFDSRPGRTVFTLLLPLT